MGGYWRNLNFQANSGLGFRWAEFISKRWDSGDVSMGPDGVNAGLHMLCYWEDLPLVCQQLLGYSKVVEIDKGVVTAATNASPIAITTSAPHNLITGDIVSIPVASGNTAAAGAWIVTVTGASTFTLNGSVGNGVFSGTTSYSSSQLQRVLPWRHPYWNQLWCTRISSIKGVQFIGKGVRVVPAQLRIGRAGSGYVSQYTLVLLQLQFTRPLYPVLDDADVTPPGSRPLEADRFTDRIWTPSVQMITREGGTYLFSGGAYVGGPAAGAQFVGAVGTRLSKVKLKRTWYQIPQDGVLDSNGYPSLLVQFLGRVNSTTFQGIPAGVALCEAIEMQPRPLQLPPELMAIQDESVQIQYDITFHIEHFDPQLGVGVTTARGHNTMPWTGNGFFYPVQSAVGSQYPYQSIDMNNMWKVI